MMPKDQIARMERITRWVAIAARISNRAYIDSSELRALFMSMPELSHDELIEAAATFARHHEGQA